MKFKRLRKFQSNFFLLKHIILLKYYRNWLFGEPELRTLKMLCLRDEIAIDVGANAGVYTYFLKKYSSFVHAIEPNPSLAMRLKNVFKRKVKIYNCALSNRNGKAKLIIPIRDEDEATWYATIEPENRILEFEEKKELDIECRKLDDLDIRQVGFIKIDVEGHELAVLEGSIQTIKRDIPNILVESEERHKPGTVNDVRRYLENMGYKGFFFRNNLYYSITEFDIRKHQKTQNINRNIRKYIQNFIYIKREEVLKKMKLMVSE